jgi:hypothetical protein
MWGALCDERTGLSFTIAADHRQHNHFRVRVPWNSRSYFTASDSRLPFSSPLTTRGATVEVFDPASTRDMYHSALHCSLYSLARIHGKCLLFARIHGKCLLIPLILKARSVPNRSPRIRISIERVSKTLSSNGLFQLSGVMSQYYYHIRLE